MDFKIVYELAIHRVSATLPQALLQARLRVQREKAPFTYFKFSDTLMAPMAFMAPLLKEDSPWQLLGQGRKG